MNIKYIAQIYDNGAYGACAYQSSNEQTTGCETSSPTAPSSPTNQTTTTTTTKSTNPLQNIFAPSTGFLHDNPWMMIPIILGVAIVFAVAMLAVKKLLRKVTRHHGSAR